MVITGMKAVGIALVDVVALVGVGPKGSPYSIGAATSAGEVLLDTPSPPNALIPFAPFDDDENEDDEGILSWLTVLLAGPLPILGARGSAVGTSSSCSNRLFM